MKNTKRKIYTLLFLFLAFWAGFFIFQYALASSDHLIINEVLISGGNGKSSEEFIELYNPTGADINLKTLPLKLHIVNSKNDDSGKVLAFSKETISKNGYFIISSKDYASSHPEAADATYSASGNSLVADGAAYISTSTKTKENIIDSIALGTNNYFDKTTTILNVDNGRSVENKNQGWQESNNIGGSPSQENSVWTNIIAGTQPDNSGIIVKMDENIYANVYANFEVAYVGATAETKYTWNFGDGGSKSYKQKLTRKFNSPGLYNASITIRGDKKGKKDFIIKVEDYDAPKIRIIRLSPNPKGKDTGNEWIEIENNSKKKVNLKDWSITTGWEKPVNHKITKKFVLKAKEIKKLTRDYCAFYLNNTKLKLELRDPSGETVQKLKYNRKKDKIEEDEIFSLAGKKWNWDKSLVENEDTEKENTENSDETVENPPLPSEEDILIPTEAETDEKTDEILFIPDSEIQANLGKFTPDISWTNKKQGRIQLISYGTAINMPVVLTNQPRVAGVSTVKLIPPEEKHWAVSLFDNSIRKINFGLNWILNKL